MCLNKLEVDDASSSFSKKLTYEGMDHFGEGCTD